jgi:hypothetical protein
VSPVPSSEDLHLPSNIPVIFLITDGAVENEYEICQFAEQRSGQFSKDHQKWEKTNQVRSEHSIRTFAFGMCSFFLLVQYLNSPSSFFCVTNP